MILQSARNPLYTPYQHPQIPRPDTKGKQKPPPQSHRSLGKKSAREGSQPAGRRYDLQQYGWARPRTQDNYFNQIDAIYTELEDELIQVKQQIHKQMSGILGDFQLQSDIKTVKANQLLSHMANLLSNFKTITSQLSQSQEKSTLPTLQSQPPSICVLQKASGQIISNRMSKALLESQ